MTGAIRDFNDRFHRGDQAIPGWILIMQGVQAVINMTKSDVATIIAVVRAFDGLSEEMTLTKSMNLVCRRP